MFPITRILHVISILVILIFVDTTLGQYGKPGDCPPPTGVGICSTTCTNDRECAGADKCCTTACGGTFCTMPVTMRQHNRGEKPGRCPARRSGPWVCSSTCVYDSDCRGRHKCCKNRCGAMACIKPE